MNDIPIGPPSASTVGEANDTVAFPLARLVVTGPVVSNGDGPDDPNRKSARNRLTHGLNQLVSAPSRVATFQLYTPPSCNAPTGTVHFTFPSAPGAIHPDAVTAPDFPSEPVAILN